MQYSEALLLANKVKGLLEPHCERIEIAGSIRRQCEQCGDIEIVCISLPYETGLFENGIAAVINQWQKIKGELEFKGRPGVKQCKYTQRLLPEGIKVDIFFATPDNWGYILAIRTGSAEYSKQLVQRINYVGYTCVEGNVYWKEGGMYSVYEEQDLFNLIKIPYCEPEKRTI